MASAGLPTAPTAQIDPPPSRRALPLPDAGHAPPPSKPPKSNLHHHDDVWNADSTFALLQAWGGRFLELNQGCLSRADWSYVTQQVLLLSGKTSLTETQCRNRIDTLKKKYKREKHKLATMGGGFSSWPYYQQLDSYLKPAPMRVPPIVALPAEFPVKVVPLAVAPPATAHAEKMDLQPAVAPAAEYVEKVDPCVERSRVVVQNAPNCTFFGDDNRCGHEAQELVVANIASASCELAESSEMSESSFKSSDNMHKNPRKPKRQRSNGNACFGVFAKALTKFADVYERVETAKQQQALDLEKARMEITRNFELQKWRLLMQTQMELAKMKGSGSDGDHSGDDFGALLLAACFMPVEYC